MNVLLSGSTGLIGKRLAQRLKNECNVIPLGLRTTNNGVRWDPETSSTFLSPFPIDETKIDAVVHLGGYPLQPIWTKRMKQRVYHSRVNGASILTKWLANLPETKRKRVFLSASAVGIYGTKPADYSGPPFEETAGGDGQGFLQTVARDAEKACDAIRSNIRVAHPRFGVVLDPNGGVLNQLLLPFKLGLGGPMGEGTQIFPWVSLDDVVEALVFALRNESEGPFNVVSPGAQETSQARFASALGRALHRPAFVPLPGFVLNAMMGREAADAMLLGSIKVAPKVLREAGFTFKDDNIEECLKKLLK